MAIQTLMGDITKIKSDAIVNAANSRLLAGGGVCGAIHSVAGPNLEEECLKIAPCPTGNAKITRAYNLPAKYVIHAVGPIYDTMAHEDACKSLMSTYNSILDEAEKYLDIKMITIPAISCGIYGFPSEPASKIAVSTIRNWRSKQNNLSSHERFEKIVFVLFDQQMKDLYDTTMKA